MSLFSQHPAIWIVSYAQGTGDVVGLGHLAMVDLGIREVSSALCGRVVMSWLLDALTKLSARRPELCHQKKLNVRTRVL